MVRILIIVFFLGFVGADAQEIDFTMNDFHLEGSASFSGDTAVVLTENLLWQGGAMWFKEDIDLTHSFHIALKIWFGCSDGGADGVVFVLHPDLGMGKIGEGIGFAGLSPSFGVEMDTYQQYHLTDIHPDHASLLAHGVVKHEPGFTEPVPLHPRKKNIENCAYHLAEFQWNPRKQIFTFTFDGIQRLKQEIDLVQALFQGNPNVYWGLTSSTGDRRNRHSVILEQLQFIENEAVKQVDQLALLGGQTYTMRQIEFTKGSSELSESGKHELDKLIQFYMKHPEFSMIIDAFSNQSKKEEVNLEISKSRAEAISHYLLSKGFPAHRFSTSGNGSYPNEEKKGKNNRDDQRIEIRMMIIKA